MKYDVKQEQELMTEIWSMNIKMIHIILLNSYSLGDKRIPPSNISQGQSGKKNFEGNFDTYSKKQCN